VSEPQGRNLNLCGERREQLTSIRSICTRCGCGRPACGSRRLWLQAELDHHL